MELDTLTMPPMLSTIENLFWVVVIGVAVKIATDILSLLVRKLYFLSRERIYWGFGIFKMRLTARVSRALSNQSKYKYEERLIIRGYFYATISAVACFFVLLVDQNLMSFELQIYLASVRTDLALENDTYGVTHRSLQDNYFAMGLGLNAFIQTMLARYSNIILELADIIKGDVEENQQGH